MEQIRQNYYGNLCTEMYEILHSEAPSDELDFYLSYAEKGKKILACRDILQYSSDRLLITSSYPPALYHFSLIFLYADSFLKK